MHLHDLDLLSLTWGVILTVVTVLLAVAHVSDVSLDLGILVPIGLIATGGLVLIGALLRKPRDPGPADGWAPADPEAQPASR